MGYKCTFVVAPELLDALSGCLFEAGAEGLVEGGTGNTLTTYLAHELELQPLRSAFELFEKHARAVFPEANEYELIVEAADESWRENWLLSLDAERVTERFVLRPRHRPERPEGEETLWYVPTASFGSGGHPTTRLCASALERVAAESPRRRLFDVGTGTGVLALVALKSGFEHVVGSDIDPVAVEALLANAAENGLQSRVTALLGSADASEESFPFVVANIETRVLHQLAPSLVARLSTGGELILSGLLEEDVPPLLARYETLGLEVREVNTEGDWALLWLRKSS